MAPGRLPVIAIANSLMGEHNPVELKNHLAHQNLNSRHEIFRSQSLVQTEACTQMGSRKCSGMGDSSSGSPEGLRCSPLLCGRKLFF